jgi:hypothetical protein
VHAPPPLLRAQAARTVPLLVQWLQLSAAALNSTAPPAAAEPPTAEPPTAPSPAAPSSAALDGRAVQLLVDLVAVCGLPLTLTGTPNPEAQPKTRQSPTHSPTHRPTPLPRCSARCCQISQWIPRRS